MSLDHEEGRHTGSSRRGGAYSCTRPATVTPSASSPAAVMVSQGSRVNSREPTASKQQARIESDPTNPDRAGPGHGGGP